MNKLQPGEKLPEDKATKVAQDKAIKSTEDRKPVTDSEGLRVSTTHNAVGEEGTVNERARGAYEDEEEAKREEFQKFLER